MDKEVRRKTLQFAFVVGGLCLVGWLFGGDRALMVSLLVLGLLLNVVLEILQEQQNRIGHLEKRLVNLDDGKASVEWVSKLAEDAERNERLHALDIERLEERLP